MERLSQTTSHSKTVSANSVVLTPRAADGSHHDHSTHIKQPYVSRQPDSQGHIHYSTDENAMWQALLERQATQIPNRACSAYLEGLKKLNLPSTYIPQLHDID